MSNETTWLDVMPAIPLSEAVPVVHRASTRPDPRGVVVYAHERTVAIAHTHPHGTVWEGYNDRIRVNLDDPQGFAYALRWLWQNAKNPADLLFALEGEGGDTISTRERFGRTTPADRLALARACAAVAGAS